MHPPRLAAAAAPGWAADVLLHLRRVVEDGERSGDTLTNGAHIQHACVSEQGGRPVLSVVYTHPWWAFVTGYRTYLDEPHVFEDVDARGLAEDIAFYTIGEPLGTIVYRLTPDADGVWWFGVDPLPGDAARLGETPPGEGRHPTV